MILGAFLYGMTMKTCTKCKVTRPREEFRKQPQNKDGLQSHCKFCQNAAKENWRKRNIERVNAHAKGLYLSNPIRAKGRQVQKFFKGLSWQESFDKYQSMLKEQNNACEICKTKDHMRALHIDHCHKSGKVRGLLCHNCNLTLGRMNESVELFQAVISYLNKHN